jgi:hypothetical protein
MPEHSIESGRKTIGKHALRLVLFGMPYAGKTSLLGALVEAAQTQENVLNGELSDLGGGLAKLRACLHEEHPQVTAEEIVPYHIHFEPRPGGGREFRGSLDAVLIDSSGLVANELLFRQELLRGKRDEGPLANSILEADTVFVVVDPSGGEAELESDFGQLARFLRLLERSRGRRTDLSGLPVFLVLTKCDLLAQPADTPGEWVERIEERKSRIAARFKDFLAHHRDERASPFGRIDLHVWATAIKRPALSGITEKPRGPFGVAELFRQGLASAQSYCRGQYRAGRKLAKTVAAVLGALGLLSGFAALLILGFWEPSGLEVRVEHFRLQQRSLPARDIYRRPRLKSEIDELAAFVNDGSFKNLPADKQEFVREELAKLHAYQAYEQNLRETIVDPRIAGNEAQLAEIEEKLRNLAIPQPYKSEWSQTEAGRQSAEWLEDIAAIRKAVQRVNNWYQQLIHDGQQVLDTSSGPNLPARAKKVLEAGVLPPFPESDRVPGSQRVTYETVFGFTSVAESRRKWEDEIKKKLEPYAKFPSP